MAASPSRPSGPPAPTPPTDRAPGTVVRWIFDVLNSHQPGALRPVLGDDVLDRLPVRTLHGPDAVVAFFDELFTALPDARFTLQAMAVEGETVLVRWQLRGTHSGGELEGIAATGAVVDIDGTDDFVVTDGRVVSNFVIFDQTQLARQLGLLPADGSRLDVGLKRAFNLLVRARG